MKTKFFSSRRPSEYHLSISPQTAVQPSAHCPRVPLHHLVNQLLAGLQPLAMKRGNVVLNGIPKELSVVAEENILAYVLWELINTAVNSKKNECIHIVVVAAGDRTMICVKDVGTYFYQTISHEYRKIQYAAEKLGGSLCLENDEVHGTNVFLSISNSRLVA